MNSFKYKITLRVLLPEVSLEDLERLANNEWFQFKIKKIPSGSYLRCRFCELDSASSPIETTLIEIASQMKLAKEWFNSLKTHSARCNLDVATFAEKKNHGLVIEPFVLYILSKSNVGLILDFYENEPDRNRPLQDIGADIED